MLKKITKVLLFLSFLFITLQAFAFADSVYPSSVTQGDEITITLSTTGITPPSTDYNDTFEPYFFVDGLSVADPATSQYKNKQTLTASFKVPRNASIGTHNVWVVKTKTAAAADAGVDVTVVSKPMILGASQIADYQHSGASITFYGNYFDTSGNASVNVNGIGYFGAATPASSSQLTISGINFLNLTPGGPGVVNVRSNDGGVGISEAGDGNALPLFTLYPAPTIINTNKSSVYQTQSNVSFKIYGAGFYSTSSVVITTNTSTTGSTNGITITSVTPNPDTGEITCILDIDKDASLGSRTLYIRNPDGKTGVANSTNLSLSNFVTYKYTPVVDTVNTSTAAAQGFSGEIIIKANSTAGNGFDPLATPTVVFSNNGDTIDKVATSVSFVDTSTLKVNIKVPEKAIPGTRTVTIANPSYGTSSTYLFNIFASSFTRLGDVALAVTPSPASIYQGETSTITLTCVSPAAFEPGATITAADGITIKNISYISPTVLWCYIVVDPAATTGNKTLTVNNPTYGVQKSTYLVVNQSPYNTLAITTVSPSEIYQGQTSTMTINCSGKLENIPTVTIGGIGLTLNSSTKISDTQLWLNLTALAKDNLGGHTITIKNPTYGSTVSTTVTVSTSSYSNPEITSSDSTTLYQGDKKEIKISGKGFKSSSVFTFTDANISIINTVIQTSTSVVLTVSVPIDMPAKTYGLIIKNDDFDASFIKQDLITVSDKHTITSISPGMLAPDSTEYFYINGTNFNANSNFKIFIDTQQVKSVSDANSYDEIIFISSRCVSSNQVACKVYVSSAMTTGVHDVGLYFESNGTTVTSRGILSVPNKPVITNIPSTVSQGDNNKEVTIQGQNFENGATVVISGSGIVLSTISVISSNIMTFRCDVTSDAEQTDRQVKVINPTGQFATGTLKVISPPKITSCSPSSVMKGTTRYLEIIGENFNENFKLSFSDKVVDLSSYTNQSDQIRDSDENALNILEVAYAGNTQISAKVYVGTSVVSGLHDIEIVNYDSTTLTDQYIQSQGIGAGKLDCRTPLKITNLVSEFRVPAGLKDKTIKITGDGFSKSSVITISGTGITITNQNFINTQEVELVIDVDAAATIGKRTVTIKDSDNSAYKQILEIIEAVNITNVAPIVIPVGLQFATMNITGIGIDIDTTTIVTKQIGGYSVTGIDGTDQVELLGGGTGDVVIDSNTASSTFLRLYFTAFSTATVGARDIRITNKDQENIILKQNAFTIDQKVKVNSFVPANYQLNNSPTDFKILGSGFEPSIDAYTTGGATITFSNSNLAITSLSYADDDEISGQFKWQGDVSDAQISNRNIDINVTKKDGSLGTLTGGLYLLEQLTVIPSLTSPTTVPINAKDFVIDIKGKGIMAGATAYFYIEENGVKNYTDITSTKMTIQDSTEFFLYVNSNASLVAGTTATLVITNPNGTTVESPGLIYINNVPAIYSCTPSSVRVGGSIAVATITGYNFLNNGVVKEINFSNGLYITTMSITDTKIVGKINTSAASFSGDATIEMKTAVGSSIAKKIFKVLEEPKISEIIPSVFYNNKAVQMYINGSNFDKGISMVIKNTATGDTSAVSIVDGDGGIRKSATSVSAESVTITEDGEYSIILTNPDGSSVTFENAITVYPIDAQAQVSELNPQYGTLGEENKFLKATGANFADGISIYAEGKGVTVSTYTVYYTSAAITMSIAADATPGSYNLVFANPNSVPTNKKFYVMATPTITSVSPKNIERGTTTQIVITGTNFVKEAGVDGGSITAGLSGDGITVYTSSTTFIGATQLNAYIYVSDNASLGNRDIIVTNPFNFVGKGAGIFNVTAPVNVTSINPNRVAQGDTNRTIIINGSGFEDGVNVAFSGTGITVSTVTYISATQLSLKVTVSGDAQEGTRSIQITNPNSVTVNVGDILTVGPKIIVERTNPSIIGRGVKGTNGNGIPVEIIGNNFDPSTNTVAISGSGVTIHNVVTNGAQSITVYLSVDEDTVLGSRDISVTTKNGSIGLGSNVLEIVDTISIDKANPSLVPVYKNAFYLYNSAATTSAIYRIDATNITLTRDGTVDSQLVLANYNIRTLVAKINTIGNGWSASAISGSSQPASYLAATSNVNVRLSTATVTFTKNGVYDSSDNELPITITGTGFDVLGSTPVVSVSGDGITVLSTNTHVNSSSEMTTKITIDPVNCIVSKRDITVQNADGSLGKGNGILEFAYPLQVTSSSPSVLGKGSISAVLKIYGEGFSDTSKVTSDFAGIGVSNVSYTGNQELRINTTIPSDFAGAISTYTVTNKNGETKKLYLNIQAVPVVTAISPFEVGEGASTTITMKGNGLADVTDRNKIIFSGNDITVLGFSVIDSTTIIANVKVSKSATVETKALSITDSNSKTGTMEDIFKIVPAPSIISISSNTVTPGTTNILTIQGSGYKDGTVITFSSPDILLLNTNYINTGKITAKIFVNKKALPGVIDLTVKNTDLSESTSSGILTISEPIVVNPTITSITPTTITQGTTVTVYLQGTSFVEGGTDVLFTDAQGIFVSNANAPGTTELTFDVYVATYSSVGLHDVKIMTENGSVISKGLVTVAPFLSIVGADPTIISRGSSNRDLWISGTGFETGSAGYHLWWWNNYK